MDICMEEWVDEKIGGGCHGGMDGGLDKKI